MIKLDSKDSLPLKVVLVDDEPLALEILCTYLSKIENIDIIACFDNPLEASNYLEHNDIDLLFLDIYMPQLSGIALMQSLSNPPMVIFTTASSCHAVEGFELDAIDYLLKPISFNRFETAIQKAKERIFQQHHNKYVNASTYRHGFMVKADKKHVEIAYEDVLFIQGLKDYVIIKLRSGQVVTLQKMKHLEDFLPPTIFKRIHKSYIVNLRYIQAMDGTKVEIFVSGKVKEIPIGRIYKGGIVSLISEKRI